MIKKKAATIAKFYEETEDFLAFFPGFTVGVKSDEYAENLGFALWADDPESLMKVLDSQDINPWDIYFVNDGMGSNSPNKQNLIDFAATFESWGCVAKLIQNYFECEQVAMIHSSVAPYIAEYEIATNLGRIEFLEAMMRASNLGVAKHCMTRKDINAVFYPAYLPSLPKSTRFILKDFATFNFKKKKSNGPIETKRVEIRQKVLAAISTRDCLALEKALGMLKANAVAYEAAKRMLFEGLTNYETERFIFVALSCDYPQGAVMLITKSVEFMKETFLAKFAGKKIDAEVMEQIVAVQKSKILERIIFMTTTIEALLTAFQWQPSKLVEEAIEMELLSSLKDVVSIEGIKQVKMYVGDRFTVMKPCIDQVFRRAESGLEKQEIAVLIPANTQEVGVQRERVRL